MTTKTINGAYAGGYYLDPSFQTLDIGTGAYVGLLGVSTTAMAPSTINNLGTVTGSHDAITLADGGRITNGGPGHSNALIKGFAPIVDADASAVTVVNDGSIISTSQNTASFTNTTYVSIVLNGGGAITNAAAGEISSGVILGARTTLTNSGSIGAPGVYYGKSAAHTNTYTTSMGASVVMLAGGEVTNETGGTVAEGVSISGGVGTITNDGRMGGAYVQSGYSNTAKGESGGAGATQAAVTLAAGGVVSNAASADLAGVVILNAAGTVTNLGDLTATGSSYFFDSAYNENSSSGVDWGVKLEDGGRVTNGSAVDTIAQAGAVTIAGAIGIVANSGTIGAETAQAGQAVYVMGYPGHFETTTDKETIAASVALGKGGRITNGSTADTQAVLASYVMISGGAGTLNNYGAVGAGYYYTFDSAGPTKERELSVQMTGGGMVRNGAASDTLAALPGGVSIAGGRGGVINYGTVGNTSDVLAGGGTYFSYSIALAMGGSVTNGSSAEPSGLIRNGVAIYGGAGTVTNSGAIQLNRPSPGYAEAAVALRNGGRITNGAATVKTASISGAVGVTLKGAGTVTNFGTIASTTAGGTALSFGSATDVLIEQGSGVLTGKVVGGAAL